MTKRNMKKKKAHDVFLWRKLITDHDVCVVMYDRWGPPIHVQSSQPNKKKKKLLPKAQWKKKTKNFYDIVKFLNFVSFIFRNADAIHIETLCVNQEMLQLHHDCQTLKHIRKSSMVRRRCFCVLCVYAGCFGPYSLCPFYFVWLSSISFIAQCAFPLISIANDRMNEYIQHTNTCWACEEMARSFS